MTRVVAYVDGFNLYFGLKAKGWKKHYWLDLNGLATSLLKPGQTLAGVHYLTSRIRANGRNVADMQRQSDYLDALATLPSLTIHYGHYLQKSRRCHSCGAQWMDYEEKMTDVNIAMQLLADAFDDHFDTALVISADSDLTTPVRQVRARFPAKRVIVTQPPGCNSVQLAGAATAAFTISETKVRQSQLPAAVTTASGYVIHRPAHWR
jgi:uncharacterized LabA/DUF88 family protein